jgi:glycosyltransferase involved in cell wall biosynthesis
MVKPITPLILTFNEEANISRCLGKLGWAEKVIVIDSFSTDKTLEIVRQFSNVEVFQRKFDGFSSQMNWGIEHIQSEWVLSLDADYVLSDELVEEIKGLKFDQGYDGYFASFKYCINGRPLYSTLLPPREVLFKKEKCRYIQDGHAHRLVNAGVSGKFQKWIYHDDRKPFSRWWSAQKKYAGQEAEKLLQTSFSQLNLQDRLRKMILFAPIIVFFYCLIGRGLILNCWNGLVYSFQRFLAETLLSWTLIKSFLINDYFSPRSRGSSTLNRGHEHQRLIKR